MHIPINMVISLPQFQREHEVVLEAEVFLRYVGYSFVAVIKHCDQGNFQEEFILSRNKQQFQKVKAHHEWRRRSRSWQQTAFKHMHKTERASLMQLEAVGLKAHLQYHSSCGKATSPTPPPNSATNRDPSLHIPEPKGDTVHSTTTHGRNLASEAKTNMCMWRPACSRSRAKGSPEQAG